MSPNSEPTCSDVFSSLSRYHNYRSSTECHHFHHIGTLFKMVPTHSPRLPDPQLKQSKFSSAKLSSGHIQLSSLPLQLINFTAIVFTKQCDQNSHCRMGWGYHGGKRSAPAKSWEPAELQLQSPQCKGGWKRLNMLQRSTDTSRRQHNGFLSKHGAMFNSKVHTMKY